MSRLRNKYKKLEEQYERLKEKYRDLFETAVLPRAPQAELPRLTNNIDKLTVSRIIDPRFEHGDQVDRTVAYAIANYLLENGYVERHVSNAEPFGRTIISYTIQTVKPFK